MATDAPSHARHCMEVLKHGKHVMCAVPAASVVGEAMVAWALADAMVEKLGGDSIEEMASRR